MAIEIHGKAEIAAMRRAGKVAAATLRAVCERVEIGVTTGEIDRWVREHTAASGARPSQLGYKGFPASVCTSVNEVVCHGVPKAGVCLKDGDIINIDVTSEFEGFHGDTSQMVCLGTVSPLAQHLVDVCFQARKRGIEQIRNGARLGDIGWAIESYAREQGCSVVREFGGHGIGKKMHMAPHVSHFGRKGSGMRLRSGMTITVEPMITVGDPDLRTLKDGWTVVTADGSPSAQFEHTVLVTDHGYEVFTV